MQKDKFISKLVNDYWLSKIAATERRPKVNEEVVIKSGYSVIKSSDLMDLTSITRGKEMEDFIIYLTAFSLLLKKHFLLDKILIASDNFCNEDEGAAKDHFLFYSPAFAEDITIKESIIAAKQEVQNAINHKNFNYSQLLEQLKEKDIYEEELLFFCINTSTGVSLRVQHRANFSLFLNKSEEGDLEINLNYNSRLFDSFKVEQFLNHFCTFIKNLKRNLNTETAQLSLLDATEEKIIVNEIIGNFVSYPTPDKNVVDLFSTQVSNNPNDIALQMGLKKYTYNELNEKSNQLACYLTDKFEVKSGDCVGVLANKSEWTIISILGILKAGAAFVPIDPSQPQERIQHITEDATIKLMLIETDQMFDYNWFKGGILVTEIEIDILKYENCDLKNKRNNNSLAYVIYTSGTTGKPKGVMIEDSSIVNYSEWFIEEYAINKDDTSLLLSSLAYDLGYTTLWGTLFSGATLHLVSVDYGTSTDTLLGYLIDHKISFIKTTPSLFYMITHIPEFKRDGSELSLRLILLGGEFIKNEDIELYHKLHPATVFVNHYGPTETTIGCITNTLTDADGAFRNEVIDAYSRLPVIGKPIKNNQVLILDEYSRLVPRGITGEICISGKGLAKGYINNSDLTASKFVQHPYNEQEKIYKTGDYGYWNKEGRVVIRGRRDNQVKIRGHRIEFGEIEIAVSKHEEIEESVVTVKEFNNQERKLVVYYKGKRELDEGAFKDFLRTILPPYMIPEFFIYLKNFPLTANGKTDLKKLPHPSSIVSGTAKNVIPPRNEIERTILQAWEEVLNKNKISVSDNFFDLGGNSIYLIKVSSMLAEHFPDLAVIDLFNYPSIEKLAGFITSNQAAETFVIQNAGVSFPLNYYIEQEELEQDSDNQEDFKFEIRDNLYQDLKNISEIENVEIVDIVKSIFCYTLSEISAESKLPIQTVLVQEGQAYINSWTINFDQVKDQQELYRIFSSSHDTHSEKFRINRNNSFLFKDKNQYSIVPLIYKKENLLNEQVPQNVFDIILEIDDSGVDRLKCVLEYNNAKLRDHKMDELVTSFFDFISGLVDAEI